MIYIYNCTFINVSVDLDYLSDLDRFIAYVDGRRYDAGLDAVIVCLSVNCQSDRSLYIIFYIIFGASVRYRVQ